MTQSIYNRVDWPRLEERAEGLAVEEQAADTARFGIRWLIIPISILLCLAQAFVTIVAENVPKVTVTSTMIPVLAFGLIMILVLGVNPFLRLSRARALGVFGGIVLFNVPLQVIHYYSPALGWRIAADIWLTTSIVALVLLGLRVIGFRIFSRAELMCVFTAMLVTSGVSTFGLSSQLVPLLPAPYNAQWNTPQRGWDPALLPNLRPELYLRDPAAGELFYQGVTHTRDGQRIEVPGEGASVREQARYYRQVFFAIPWGAWIPPLTYWLILIAGVYGLFYSLAYVVLPYWRDREKLIFPLARLPESLLPDEHNAGGVPSIFKGPAFWIGFAISAGVLAWNAAAINTWIEPSFRIILGMSGGSFDTAVANSIWMGLGNGGQWGGSFGMMFLIIFTAIGIAFLLPLEISFSIWFYFLVGKAIILIAVWMGYGRTAMDFPSDWLWFNNPVSAQGGGGLFFFSAMSLFRCLKDYVKLIRGRSPREALRIAMPVVGLVVSMFIVTWWLQWNHIGWLWGALITLFLTLVTVGLMRIVAEGGVYWFQSHTSFFHLYKMLGLGKFLAAPLMAPLIPIYSVLFLDIKTFMAPNLLNAGAMRNDVGGSRAKFHINIVLCIAITVVFSIGFAIFLAHQRGALQGMHSWFYVSGPPMILDTARDATREVSEFNATTTAWWGIGAVWVALSMYLRTWLFWFPHPIGYIMLINPLMTQLWFSFFLGWACKKIVVQYGGKNTFDKVRGAFIGLIMGELISIFFWMVLSLVYTGLIKSAGIDLNRYS